MAITSLLEQLKRDEGWRDKPYQDTMGNVTIGYGTNLAAGISTDEGEYLLVNRMNQKNQDLSVAFPWMSQMDPVRRAVFQNMAYNMGVSGVMQFKMTLALAKAGSWQLAAEQMRNSRWAQQVGERAERLALQMETGEWQ